ncbi:MAG: AMIN domain-containing protein [Gammaproteobacteria bacterium]|nr:AMIN domain-containing protein [Gammaproteobacteria bacterium]
MTVCVLALTLASIAAAQTVQVKDVRIAHADSRTRVVLDLSNAAEHNLFDLTNPNRVVVDLSNARFATGPSSLPAATGLVAGLRVANRETGTARLVLDLDEPVRAKSFSLAPGAGQGHRLVIDLQDVGAAAPVVRTSPQLQQQRELVIAIDAGHGGKDPGARGRSGLLEKDVVLRISKRLAALIEAEPGMRPYLTRSGDQFLKLGERIKRAQDAGADLFLSIHADAFTDRRVRGASVYVLSRKGATDEASKLLAQRENDADLIGGVDISDKDERLASVLVDLSQTASKAASIEVGDLLIGEIGRVGKIRKPKVQKAGFRVLKAADIPSVLIETAFISNPQDENNLRSVQYQQRLAQAIHSGVRKYFYANPPAGTQIAALRKEQRRTREHVIRRGDTLSQIAQRYNVSLSQLRATNSISGSRIRVGQVLRIPPGVGI